MSSSEPLNVCCDCGRPDVVQYCDAVGTCPAGWVCEKCLSVRQVYTPDFTSNRSREMVRKAHLARVPDAPKRTR